MGAFDDVPNVVLPDPDNPEASDTFRKKWKWEPHEQVTLRGLFTAADQEAVENASAAFSGTGKQTQVEARFGNARHVMMARIIVSWTFTLRGQPVPVSADSIRRLPTNYRIPILDACDQIAQANVLAPNEQTDFFSSANGHTAGNSNLTTLSPTNSSN